MKKRKCDCCKRRVEFSIIDPRCWLPFFGCSCKFAKAEGERRMNQKTISIALAIGGFLGVIHATFIEPSTFGICFAGFYIIIGFWNWIEIENSELHSDTTKEDNNENKRKIN